MKAKLIYIFLIVAIFVIALMADVHYKNKTIKAFDEGYNAGLMHAKTLLEQGKFKIIIEDE